MPENEWYDPSPGERQAIDDRIAAHAATDQQDENAVFSAGNSGSAKTIDRANGRVQKLTLTASGATLTVTGFTAGEYGEILLYLVQDGTGSRTVPTFSPAADYGTAGAPTLSTTAAKVDLVKLSSIDGGTTLDVVLVEKGI